MNMENFVAVCDKLVEVNNEVTTLTERLDNLVSRIEKMTSQDIQLIGGEMSRQELRTARALLDWVAREIRNNTTQHAN